MFNTVFQITQQATASESYACSCSDVHEGSPTCMKSETGFLVDRQKAETVHSSIYSWGGFLCYGIFFNEQKFCCPLTKDKDLVRVKYLNK